MTDQQSRPILCAKRRHPARAAIAFYVAVQKHIAHEYEVCCGVNFALPIQYFQHTRGIVNNFQQYVNFEFATVETPFMITAPLHDIPRWFCFSESPE